MTKFKGFSASESFVQVPSSFLSDLCPAIDDLDELKVTLYALWQLGAMEGPVHFLRLRDFKPLLADPALALEKAVRRGSLIEAQPKGASGKAVPLYFLNSPRGRAAAEAYTNGEWQPSSQATFVPLADRPNIFKLYEENIGPLTPMIADALKDAEETYRPDWVAEALTIAVKNNKRNWRYVEAILRRWKEEGHAQKQDRRHSEEDGRRYTEGEYSDFIEH